MFTHTGGRTGESHSQEHKKSSWVHCTAYDGERSKDELLSQLTAVMDTTAVVKVCQVKSAPLSNNREG
jgi:acetolactate synthase regulatory subunit